WPKVVIGILLIFILLVVFLPQIASLGFVRSIVVGKVNNNLNGKVAIDNWSLGWTGGVDVKGVKVYDESGKEILNVPKVSTKLSLIDAIRGRYKLGKTSVEGPVTFAIVVDKNGKTNLQKIAKETAPKAPSGPKKAAEPSKLPNVSGDFNVEAKGTIEQPDKPVVYV